MPTCLRCNWVLNSPIKGTKLSELLGSALLWLDSKGVKKLRAIKSRTLKMIGSYKGLNMDSNKGIALCRHCLMESVSLLVPERLMPEFKKTFIDVYDFGSVIY